MKVQKTGGIKGEFAKVGTDLKDGDIVEILNAGQVTVGEFGEQNVFSLRLADGSVKNKAFNQSSINNLIDAFSDETESWIGKKVKTWVVRAMISGKLQNVAYFADPSWTMLDDGSFSEGKAPVSVEEEPIRDEEIPF